MSRRLIASRRPTRVWSRLIAAALICCSPSLWAGTGVESWVQRFGLTTATDDVLVAMQVDGQGNVIVAGHTQTGVSEIERALVTVKYRNDGTAWWTNRYQPLEEDYLTTTALTVDPRSGQIHVSGYSLGRSGTYNYVTVAYSGDGFQLWTSRYGGTGWWADHFAMATAVDAEDGNVYVAGFSTGEFIEPDSYGIVAYSSVGAVLWTHRFDSNHSYHRPVLAVDGTNGQVYLAFATPGDNWDCVTIAFSSSGVPLWTNRFNGAATSSDRSDLPAGMAVDPGRGKVYLLCPSHSIAQFGLVAYSSTGSALWTNVYNNPTNAFWARAIVVNPVTGTVHVAGGINGGSQGNDFATVAYSTDGIPLWTNRCDVGLSGAYSPSDLATAMDVDALGNVYLAGTANNGTNSLQHCATLAYSSHGVPLWTNRYLHAVSGVAPVAVAVDRTSGRVFVGAASSDYVTLAYTTAGAAEWTNLFSGQREVEDFPRAIVLDRQSSNAYVTGSSREGPYDDDDWLTVAYSADGVLLWTRRFNGSAGQNDVAQVVEVDDVRGRIHVAGSATFSANQMDYAVLTYSSGGSSLRTNRYNGPGNHHDSIQAMAVNRESGNFVVTGYSTGAGSTYADFATIAYASTGLPLWTNRYDGGVYRDDQASAVVIEERSGKVFVTGYSSRVDGYNRDFITIGYSGTGTPLWTNRYHGPVGSANDSPHAMAINRDSGHVYVTGHSGATPQRHDFATIAYSGEGRPLWTNRYDGPNGSSDVPEAIAIDESTGRVYVSGSSDSGYGGSFAALVVVAYTGDGTALWTNSYKASAGSSDYGKTVAVDGNGHVYVTGYSLLNSDFDQVTLVYSGAGIPLYTNLYRGPRRSEDRPTARTCLAVTADGEAFVTGISRADFLTIKYVFPPEIYLQPQPQATILGSTMSFIVGAAGTHPLSYRWQHGDLPLFDAGNISGAASPLLQLSSVEWPDAGDYTVVVSNPNGTAASRPARLTVHSSAPHLTGLEYLPSGGVVISGSTASNSNLRLEFSTNLIVWMPLATLTNAGIFVWKDFETTNTMHRFYRALLLPSESQE